MGFVTDSITYNVKHRGRKHTGQDRNFDTAALAKLVNGPETQERVRAGDMVGYYGHWPRIKLGMQPAEGGIVDGAVVSVAPAFRTVQLSADANGDITHKAEFLDTEPGEIALRLFKSNQGGFSTAIETVPRTSPAIPRLFAGLDFVLCPNYNGNRGHSVSLDSAGNPDLSAMLDSALELAAMGDETMARLFDSLYEQHHRTLQALEQVSRENELLIARLARGKPAASVALDGLGLEDVRVAPMRITPGSIDSMRAFKGASLPGLQELPVEDDVSSPEAHALRRLGVF
jgi:hypothetical protein